VIALHARHVSSERRRQGTAHLQWVSSLRLALERAGLSDQTRVISNGNVNCYHDCAKNLQLTGAAGLMIGEALLEYLSLCCKYPKVSNFTIRHHIKAFFASRKEFAYTFYFKQFCYSLNNCNTINDFRSLMQGSELTTAWPILKHTE